MASRTVGASDQLTSPLANARASGGVPVSTRLTAPETAAMTPSSRGIVASRAKMSEQVRNFGSAASIKRRRA